jgi:hypothetical protein
MSSTIFIVASVAMLLIGWVAASWYQRRTNRAYFKQEFERLVESTAIDWRTLRGPGRIPPAVLGSDPANLQAKPISAAERGYYAASWKHVKSEFVQSPVPALELAEQLTGDLLLARGLVPAESWRPGMLPESWTFRTAQGYRQAHRISARACARPELRGSRRHEAEVPQAELADALAMFEEFYRELLAIPATESSDT